MTVLSLTDTGFLSLIGKVWTATEFLCNKTKIMQIQRKQYTIKTKII